MRTGCVTLPVSALAFCETKKQDEHRAMHVSDEIPVKVFNTLLGINNSRIESYVFAHKQCDSDIFRTLFKRLVETSFFCKETLSKEIFKLGGVPCENTFATPGLFSAWHKMYSSLMENEKLELADGAYEFEFIVRKSYAELLKENKSVLNTQQLSLLHSQQTILTEDHQRVNNLRCILTRTSAA